jgi:AcrR family transcriptional regulator
MPPKVKVTRENIINAAVEIVRQQGDQAINARALADVLHCSTQPIFSNFANMGQLRIAVAERAEAVCNDYIAREIASEKYPAYKASGMAYIRFAKEEKELFKFLYMRDRTGETIPETAESFEQMADMVQANTGLSAEQTRLFHLEMWVVVHGIATMFATGFLDLDWNLVSRMLTDTYLGLRKQYGME